MSKYYIIELELLFWCYRFYVVFIIWYRFVFWYLLYFGIVLVLIHFYLINGLLYFGIILVSFWFQILFYLINGNVVVSQNFFCKFVVLMQSLFYVQIFHSWTWVIVSMLPFLCCVYNLVSFWFLIPFYSSVWFWYRFGFWYFFILLMAMLLYRRFFLYVCFINAIFILCPNIPLLNLSYYIDATVFMLRL